MSSSAGGGNATAVNNEKTRQVQQQVDEVIGIMQNNIEKVMQRGEKLDSLQNKTEDLQQGALQFKKGASRVRREMWLKNLKMKIIIFVIIAILLALIIYGIVKGTK